MKVKDLKVGDVLVDKSRMFWDSLEETNNVTVKRITSTRVYVGKNDREIGFVKKAKWPLPISSGSSFINSSDEIAPQDYWDKMEEEQQKLDKAKSDYLSYLDSLSYEQLEKVNAYIARLIK